MAFLTPSNSRRGRRALASEINITPLVDVMLVLLIIFMVTAPMMISGVDVNLPKSKAAPISADKDPLVIAVNEKGEIFIMQTKIKREKLREKLKAIIKERGSEEAVFIKGDSKVSYDIIIKTMAEIQAAGLKRIALISEADDEAS